MPGIPQQQITKPLCNTGGKRRRSYERELKVRVTVVGRASRRWRGAPSPTEADRLNQALSEARAQNLRKPVEDILKKSCLVLKSKPRASAAIMDFLSPEKTTPR